MVDDVGLKAPPRSGLYREARGVLELPRLIVRLPQLARAPRGDGAPVLVVPGYGSGDGSMAALRAYLGRLGYAPHRWGLGRNAGDVPELLPRVAGRLREVAEQSGRRVHLVGWSLGGYLAREAARDDPARVARVITLGSPVVGGPKHTAVAAAYRQRGVDLERIDAWVEARYARPLTAPVTAIYSRADAIVDWRACIDDRSPDVEHVEVRTTHLGFGFSPEVYALIAERLARPR